MTPRPPCWAMAMANRASVTVSMAAEMTGMLSRMSRVRRVETSTKLGWSSDLAGRRRTASNVRLIIKRDDAELLGDLLQCPGFQAVATVRQVSGVYTLQVGPSSQSRIPVQ